jgi:hypothetical protein
MEMVGTIYERTHIRVYIRYKRRQGIKTKSNTTVKTILNTSSGEGGWFTSGTWRTSMYPLQTEPRGIKIKMKTVVKSS